MCLSSRTGHPCSAAKLYKYLAEKSLADRDLYWSEFLRSCEATSAVNRVMDWIQISERAVIGQDTAANLICLCALFLTTTVRTLRDRATHCLVLLGEQHPALLFEASMASLAFNDPYVPERMLAASYGTLMRKWAFPPSGLAGAAVTLATYIRDRLAGSYRTAPIEHILLRDYSDGIIELASKLSPAYAPLLPIEKVSKKSRIPNANRISAQRVKAAEGAIHMDFDNYTTGRLVENRRNYDSKHAEYRGVQRQILVGGCWTWVMPPSVSSTSTAKSGRRTFVWVGKMGGRKSTAMVRNIPGSLFTKWLESGTLRGFFQSVTNHDCPMRILIPVFLMRH